MSEIININEAMNNEIGMVKCTACSRLFELDRKIHYIARANVNSVIASALVGTDYKLFDAFDCPRCGCQNIIGDRKHAYNGINTEQIKEEKISFDDINSDKDDENSEEADNELKSKYDSLSKDELFKLCEERTIKVKKKKSKDYYIELLIQYDKGMNDGSDYFDCFGGFDGNNESCLLCSLKDSCQFERSF